MDVVEHVRNELAALADPDKAQAMAAYLKTDMPFYGVQAAPRRSIVKRLVKAAPAASHTDYLHTVADLWQQPHREEKYAAIDYAILHPAHIVSASVPLYRKMIVEGAWWDLVDPVAADLVGGVLATERAALTPTMVAWSHDDDLWLRRTSLICQLRHKEATDTDLLFELCTRLAPEREFFIRKAIGWALRQYAWTNPDAVRAYLDRYGDELSGLSRREAGKHL